MHTHERKQTHSTCRFIVGAQQSIHTFINIYIYVRAIILYFDLSIDWKSVYSKANANCWITMANVACKCVNLSQGVPPTKPTALLKQTFLGLLAGAYASWPWWDQTYISDCWWWTASIIDSEIQWWMPIVCQQIMVLTILCGNSAIVLS